MLTKTGRVSTLPVFICPGHARFYDLRYIHSEASAGIINQSQFFIIFYQIGPTLSKFRDPVSTWIHLISALLSVAGLVLLLFLGRNDLLLEFALLLYGLSLVLMFSSSTIYHAV
jgi:predicted membrane channel-forming protein YqfA (hemolysin III family)